MIYIPVVPTSSFEQSTLAHNNDNNNKQSRPLKQSHVKRAVFKVFLSSFRRALLQGSPAAAGQGQAVRAERTWGVESRHALIALLSAVALASPPSPFPRGAGLPDQPYGAHRSVAARRPR